MRDCGREKFGLTSPIVVWSDKKTICYGGGRGTTKVFVQIQIQKYKIQRSTTWKWIKVLTLIEPALLLPLGCERMDFWTKIWAVKGWTFGEWGFSKGRNFLKHGLQMLYSLLLANVADTWLIRINHVSATLARSRLYNICRPCLRKFLPLLKPHSPKVHPFTAQILVQKSILSQPKGSNNAGSISVRTFIHFHVVDLCILYFCIWICTNTLVVPRPPP